MRKNVLVLAIVLVAAAGLSAQSMPWDPPVPDVEEGKTLIAVGFWADVIGLGLIAGGSAAYSLDVGVANGLIGAGLTSLLFVGNPCLHIGLTRHHEAAVERGFTIDVVNKNKSRTLHLVALGCGGGSLVLGIAGAVTSTFGLVIASNIVGIAGAVVEVVNFYIFRRNWGLDLRAAAGIEVL
jgi:hypothetical protein